jgi:hypothetical protein
MGMVVGIAEEVKRSRMGAIKRRRSRKRMAVGIKRYKRVGLYRLTLYISM